MFASPSEWTLFAATLLLHVAFLSALVAAVLFQHWWPLGAFGVAWLALDIAIVRFAAPVARKAPIRGFRQFFWASVIAVWAGLGFLVLKAFAG